MPASVEVVVDEACGLAVLRGADVFAPGILALPPGAQPGTTVTISIPSNFSCLLVLTSYGS